MIWNKFMKFDELIVKQYEELGIVKEDVQTSNVINDFFKSIKAVKAGGSPKPSPVVSASDPAKLPNIKNLTSPTYAEALQNMQTVDDFNSQNVSNQQPKENYRIEDIVAVNVFNVLNTNKIAGASLTVTLDQLINPDVKGRSGSDERSRNLDINTSDYQKMVDIARTVLDPAIDAKVLKWEDTAEFSKKDLFNKGVNKGVKTATGVVSNTAGELASGVKGSFANM